MSNKVKDPNFEERMGFGEGLLYGGAMAGRNTLEGLLENANVDSEALLEKAPQWFQDADSRVQQKARQARAEQFHAYIYPETWLSRPQEFGQHAAEQLALRWTDGKVDLTPKARRLRREEIMEWAKAQAPAALRQIIRKANPFDDTLDGKRKEQRRLEEERKEQQKTKPKKKKTDLGDSDTDGLAQRTVDSVYGLATQRPEMLGSYGGLMADAAQRGPSALLVTHQTLARRDPHYNKLLGLIAQHQDEE